MIIDFYNKGGDGGSTGSTISKGSAPMTELPNAASYDGWLVNVKYNNDIAPIGDGYYTYRLLTNGDTQSGWAIFMDINKKDGSAMNVQYTQGHYIYSQWVGDISVKTNGWVKSSSQDGIYYWYKAYTNGNLKEFDIAMSKDTYNEPTLHPEEVSGFSGTIESYVDEGEKIDPTYAVFQSIGYAPTLDGYDVYTIMPNDVSTDWLECFSVASGDSTYGVRINDASYIQNPNGENLSSATEGWTKMGDDWPYYYQIIRNTNHIEKFFLAVPSGTNVVKRDNFNSYKISTYGNGEMLWKLIQ